jgi:hypothetical protein
MMCVRELTFEERAVVGAETVAVVVELWFSGSEGRRELISSRVVQRADGACPQAPRHPLNWVALRIARNQWLSCCRFA